MNGASGDSKPRPRVLVIYGGWSGHEPKLNAEYALGLLSEFEATSSDDLGLLRPEVLAKFDLFIPIWTGGELAEQAGKALAEAVQNGLGVLAWHGASGAFGNNKLYSLLVGGHFLIHDGGGDVHYSVRFRPDDPLVSDLDELSLTSEQYYLQIDPAVTVLATTSIVADGLPWLKGVEMPVAWKRSWGQGRVFYCSLGHSLAILEDPKVRLLLSRAARWACRGQV